MPKIIYAKGVYFDKRKNYTENAFFFILSNNISNEKLCLVSFKHV